MDKSVDLGGATERKVIGDNGSKNSHGISGLTSCGPIFLEPYIVKINLPRSKLWLQKVVNHSDVKVPSCLQKKE